MTVQLDLQSLPSKICGQVKAASDLGGETGPKIAVYTHFTC